MPSFTIKLEKEDINTIRLGVNIMVICKDNINLIFTKESIEELISDYNNIITKEL